MSAVPDGEPDSPADGTAVVWFRRDLRVRDQPTFLAAAARPGLGRRRRGAGARRRGPWALRPHARRGRRILLADLAGHSGGRAATVRTELAWREFYADVLWRHPESARENFDRRYDAMPWDSGPVAQGERFDPHGDYVRRFVPELRDVPGTAVHRPWDLPDGLPERLPVPHRGPPPRRGARGGAGAVRARQGSCGLTADGSVGAVPYP